MSFIRTINIEMRCPHCQSQYTLEGLDVSVTVDGYDVCTDNYSEGEHTIKCPECDEAIYLEAFLNVLVDKGVQDG